MASLRSSLTLSKSNGRSQDAVKFPVIDAIIEGLNEEEWAEDEKQCLQDTQELLNNVKNFTLWATWVFDANKLPSGNLYGSWIQLSNYDQCLHPPWLKTHPQFKTQYCTGEVEMTRREMEKGSSFGPYDSTDVYLKTKTKHGYLVNQFIYGVCVLASCKPHSVSKIMKHMYLGTHFATISNPNITIYECEVAGETKEYEAGFYVLVWSLVILLSIAVGSTIIRKREAFPPDSTVAKIMESFCMETNSAELTKSHKDEIKSLNGIRSLTLAGIVYVHMVYITVMSGCANSGNFDNRIWLFDKMLNMNILVDTYFAMSGMLRVISLLGRKQINVFLVLWKRYVRLIGLFGFAMFYYVAAAKYHASGPLSSLFYQSETCICKENWWRSILMLNSSNFTYCYAVTWYIACDYQYTVLATLLIYLYNKNKRIALRIFGLAAVASVTIPGILTYWHKLPAIYYLDIGDVLKMRSDIRMTYTYFSSYSRAGPYIVGMCLGYLMHTYKPSVHKRSLPVLPSIAGAVVSLYLMKLTMCLGSFFLEREYNVIEVSLAAAFYRSIWAVGVCGIIVLCEYGKLPLLADFFNLPFFVPISRLSYGAYLAHSLVFQQTNKVLTVKTAPVFDAFAIIVDTLGVGLASSGISYVLWLILDAPLNNLSDRFICTWFTSKEVVRKAKEHTEKNGVNGDNTKIKDS